MISWRKSQSASRKLPDGYSSFFRPAFLCSFASRSRLKISGFETVKIRFIASRMRSIACAGILTGGICSLKPKTYQRMSKPQDRAEVIENGILSVPLWGCEIPYEKLRITSIGNPQLTGRDELQSDQQQVEAVDSASECAPPNGAPVDL